MALDIGALSSTVAVVDSRESEDTCLAGVGRVKGDLQGAADNLAGSRDGDFSNKSDDSESSFSAACVFRDAICGVINSPLEDASSDGAFS